MSALKDFHLWFLQYLTPNYKIYFKTTPISFEYSTVLTHGPIALCSYVCKMQFYRQDPCAIDKVNLVRGNSPLWALPPNYILYSITHEDHPIQDRDSE